MRRESRGTAARAAVRGPATAGSPSRLRSGPTHPRGSVASRSQGIDAFQGTYTTGAGYRVDLYDPEQRSCSETFGLIDGRVTHGEEFGGISPLIGDTKVDPDRVGALLEALMKSRLAVAGSLREVWVW